MNVEVRSTCSFVTHYVTPSKDMTHHQQSAAEDQLDIYRDPLHGLGRLRLSCQIRKQATQGWRLPKKSKKHNERVRYGGSTVSLRLEIVQTSKHGGSVWKEVIFMIEGGAASR